MLVFVVAAYASEPVLQISSDTSEVKIGQISFSATDSGKVLDVDSVLAGGAELRALHCTGVVGGMFGPPLVGSALAAIAPALTACAPKGAATRLRWTWASALPTGVTVEAASAKDAQSCIAATFAKLAGAPNWTGTCSAVVLSGDPTAAAAAMATLGGG